MEIQTIFKLHTDDNKSKYSKGILKSAKKNNEKLCTKQTSAAGTTEFLIKIINIKKYLIRISKKEICFHEIIKFR